MHQIDTDAKPDLSNFSPCNQYSPTIPLFCLSLRRLNNQHDEARGRIKNNTLELAKRDRLKVIAVWKLDRRRRGRLGRQATDVIIEKVCDRLRSGIRACHLL